MSIPKADINRLSSGELSYELLIRGLTDVGSVDQMRKTLRSLLKLESEGSPVEYPPYSILFNVDHTQLLLLCDEIESLLEDFDGFSRTDSDKISAKINFALRRFNKSNPQSNEDNVLKSRVLIRILNLKSDFERKIKRHERSLLNQSLGVPDLDLIDNSDDSSASDTDAEPIPSSVPLVSTSPHPKITVPISKWNVKFSGEPTGLSLSAFLIRIDELKQARGATDSDLYNSAIDLFEGKALIYFRAMKKSVNSWKSLVQAIRKEFQPPDFNDRLFDEIKSRTQGPQESMGMFVACLENMFDRLTIQVRPATRLKIMLNNVAPFYQTQLGLHKIQSTDELLEIGKMLEARKTAVESFRAPPRRSNRLLEPDLAYLDTAPVVSADVIQSPFHNTFSSKKNLTCFNCKKAGHLFRACSEAKNKFCFRCGLHGHTVKTCPNCFKPENSNRRY